MSIDTYETMVLYVKYTCLPFPFPCFPNRSKISIGTDCCSLLSLQIQFPEIHTLITVL